MASKFRNRIPLTAHKSLVFGAAAVLTLYAILPLARNGIGSRAQGDILERARTAPVRLSTSDLLLLVSEESLVVASLTPAVVRTLAEAGLEVRSLPDLPGVLPILALLAGAARLAMPIGRNVPRPAAIRRVRRLLVGSGAVVLYLWYWTGTADHNVIHGQLLTRPWTGSLIELFMWYVGLLVCLPVILAAGALTMRVVDARPRDTPSSVSRCYLTLVAFVALMFPPEPYSRYAVLGWWPLLLGLSLIACAGISRVCLERSTTPS